MKRMRKWLACMMSIAILLGLVVLPVPVQAVLHPGVTGLARQAAAEGIVMLKNENNVLPFAGTETVSVFGRVQNDYFYCGYGSGGDVRRPYNVNLMEGLRNNGKIKLNESLASVYESWCAANRVESNPSWGQWPYSHAEMPLTEELVSEAAGQSDVAVVVIGRSAGEDRESKREQGSYYLTDLEIDMLDKVTASFEKVVVLLDVGNVIDMAWVDNYPGIDALFYAWHGGMESGNAVADVLSGDVTPSGKLTATIANTYEDYPSAGNFGNRASTNYVEDIFVGYRYFETFEGAKDKVKYPFGYGLSYTDFDIATNSVTVADGKVNLDITVTNTGDYKGKEVIQVYYGAPQGQLGKAAKSLAAYAKTNIIQPGGSENLKLSFAVDGMASYDDGGYTGHKSAWVMEAGEYPVYVGNSVREVQQVGAYTEPALRVVEQLEEAGAVYPESSAFNRLRPAANGEVLAESWSDTTPVRSINLKERIETNFPADKPYDQGDQGIDLIDVYNEEATLEDFMAQMSADELLMLTTGAGDMGHSLGISGNASVFGGINRSMIDKYGISPLSSTDGPSGIRMSAQATLLPIGTTLACTWNDRLVEQLYAGVGQEMLLNGSDTLLAPGMNLQRDPLCGRNFEYFSEDPLVTGMMGVNVVRGIQSQGAAATPKHYAANNQETNRAENDSRVSERALREIYLKGFEICVKTAKPLNIMTAYNKVNSVWAHYSYELVEVILRDQWGFDGMVMTDWWMKASQDPDYPENNNNTYRVRSGVDVLMPGSAGHTGVNMYSGNPATAVQEGRLNVGELQYCAANTLNFVLRSAKFRRDNQLPYYVEDLGERYFQTEQQQSEEIAVNMIYMDGEELPGFSAQTKGYQFFSRTLESFPEITATADDGIELLVTQATPARPYATVEASKGASEAIYRVSFTNRAGLEPNPGITNPVYALLNMIYVDGQPLAGYYPTLSGYSAYVADPANVEVTADAPDGVSYEVTRPSGSDVITVRAESDHQAKEYRINLNYYVPPAEEYLPKSDEFDEGPLNDFWTVGNQTDKFSKENGYVQIVTEDGDWYMAAQQQKNYVWQHAQGSWESVTKITVDKTPGVNYHQMGVMVYQNADSFIQFVLEYNNWDGLQTMPYKVTVKNQISSSSNTATSLSAADNNAIIQGMPSGSEGPYDLYFRVTKKENTYTFEVSRDGADYRRVGTSFTRSDFSEPKFSLLALNGATPPFDEENPPEPITVQYDYTRFDLKDPEVPQPVPNPVTTIRAEGNSKVLLATDYYSITGTSSNGMRPENCSDPVEENPSQRNLGYTAAGEYALYELDVEQTGYYSVTPRISAGNNDASQNTVSFNFNGLAGVSFTTGYTGGWQNWISPEPKTVYLTQGTHLMMLYCDTGGYNLGVLNFDPVEAYQVTFADVANGTVSAARESYLASDTVVLNVVPAEGYQLKAGTLQANGVPVGYADGVYSFTMPAEDVTVSAEFEPVGTVQKAELQALYETNRDREDIGYTTQSWQIFQSALTAAQQVLENDNATQQQVDQAKDRLQAAIDGLEIPQVPVESVKINLGVLTNLKRNKPLQLNVTINPENATDKTLAYVSSNPNVLTVDENGLVIGVKPGTARVTVTAHNGLSHTVTIRVTA